MTSKASFSMRDVMVPVAEYVTPSDSLAAVTSIMQASGVRHLPVIDGHRIVGVISLADVFTVETLVNSDPDRTSAREAMAPDPFVVSPDDRLERVTHEMAVRHIGSAFVEEEGRIVGVFTTSDACRVLSGLLAETS
jgi:acetoin utilization protein AcuB